MRKVKINLKDLITVLEAMQDSGGATEIILFEHEGYPALSDADNQENVITFQAYDEEAETKDGDSIH